MYMYMYRVVSTDRFKSFYMWIFELIRAVCKSEVRAAPLAVLMVLDQWCWEPRAAERPGHGVSEVLLHGIDVLCHLIRIIRWKG